MYYQCPDCGFKQKSEAEKRIECHRCGRSYKRRTAKTVEKNPGEDGEAGFFKYTKDGEG